jgi:hypothetical protein
MTGNKRKQQGKTIVGAVETLAKRNPRMNLSGRLNENVSTICGNEYNSPCIVPNLASAGHGTVYLAPGNVVGRSNAAVQNVGKFFQKGLYLPGTFVKYIPSVGLNTPGNIIIGYLDSPDLIHKWGTLAEGAQLNFIRDLNNARTCPVWQELTFPLTQPPRRRVFMIDSSILSTPDEIDQAVQGIFVWCVFGATPPSGPQTFGQLMIHARCRFEEVKSFQNPT